MKDEMTIRERMLASLNFEEVDRLAFWPKINNPIYKASQAEKFRQMSLSELYGWIGCDRQGGTDLPPCFKEIRKRCGYEEREGDGVREFEFVTPIGTCKSVWRYDVGSESWHPEKYPVENLRDIEIMTAFYEDTAVEVDVEIKKQAVERVKEMGESRLTHDNIGESPLMYWVEWLAGVERAHFLLMDYCAEVERLFAAMQRVLVKKAEVLAEHSPCAVLYMIENTSTTLISPEQYRRYCLGHITEYGNILRERGRILILHMCGHLKGLLDDLAKLPVRAFEAFTTPSLGDAHLVDGRRACPDISIIGGTNAGLWLGSEDEIVEAIESELDALDHHRGIILSSAGVMPPGCSPETIKKVFERIVEIPLKG